MSHCPVFVLLKYLFLFIFQGVSGRVPPNSSLLFEVEVLRVSLCTQQTSNQLEIVLKIIVIIVVLHRKRRKIIFPKASRPLFILDFNLIQDLFITFTKKKKENVLCKV